MTRRTSDERMRWIPLGLLAVYLVLSSFVMGLSSNDDSGYLNGSLWFHRGGFLHYQDWSPLYVLWFKLLTILCPNPIACYFLSWGLLAALLTLLPTWFRIRSAWIYAVILLGLPFLTIDPFVSLFGAAVLLVGTCLTLRRDRPISEAAAVFCCFAFVTAFARPEFDYGLYLGVAVTLLALMIESLMRRKAGMAALQPMRSIAFGCVIVFLAAVLFTITRHARVPRSGIAFAQHYNRRAMERGTIPFNGWWSSNYTQRHFGVDPQGNAETTTATIFDFFRASPRHFLGHMRENLKDIRTIELIAVFSLFVLWPWVRREARNLRSASVFVLLIGAPCIAATITIYPRSHYAMVLVPSLTIYALQLFDAARWLSWRPITVLCAGSALIWLSRIGLPARAEKPDMSDRIYLQQVECTRQVDSTTPPWTPAFESVPIFDVYFVRRRPIVDIATLPQWSGFTAWASQQHPAWIAVDDKLAARYGITYQQLDATLRNSLGYVPHPCPFEAHLTIYTADPGAPER